MVATFQLRIKRVNALLETSKRYSHLVHVFLSMSSHRKKIIPNSVKTNVIDNVIDNGIDNGTAGLSIRDE